MNKLLTQADVCELLRIKYGTLYRMLNTGDFVPPVNGRGRKLLFDPAAVEAWIKSRQATTATAPPNVNSPIREMNDYQKRQKLAAQTLQTHRVSREVTQRGTQKAPARIRISTDKQHNS